MKSVVALLGSLTLLVPGAALSAATVEYDLTIARQEMNFTGHPVKAMTINGELPGPSLRFTEGDHAVIRVHNWMDVETSIHWHGILLPNAMDGVPFLTYPPIAPGETFTYEFDLRQSGTYWYHSHTMLQEQRGLFGALVIAPKSAGEFDGLRDHVVVLSDWTDEDASSVLHTLKRGSEWYSIRKGSGQSVLGAARLGLLGAYFSRELQRMPPMDLADVYYDRFLLNGAPQQSLAAKPGEKIRLRVIAGSASTFFYLQFAGGPMQVIAADGQLVQPFDEDRMLIAVAETYDVIVTVPSEGSYEFRATAHDGSGRASLWIGSGPQHAAPDIPFPNLYVNMGSLTIKRVLALTPGGSMGMPGSAVRAGMMHHPMHLHGHFFRVLNAQGEFSPLKHTVDVAPMTTTVIEFAADEFGDWFFHCHLLYHMMSGMARVVHYQDFAPDPATAAVRPHLYHDEFGLFGQVDVLSQMTQGALGNPGGHKLFADQALFPDRPMAFPVWLGRRPALAVLNPRWEKRNPTPKTI